MLGGFTFLWGLKMRSQLEIFKVLLTKDVAQATTYLYKLQQAIKRVVNIIDNLDEEQKEKVYQVAGDLLTNIPKYSNDLDMILSKIMYALNIIWRKELRVSLPFSDRSEVEELITSTTVKPEVKHQVKIMNRVARKIAQLSNSERR